LLQLWQQYQQQGKAQHTLLPEVHLELGPNLRWVASSSNSNSRSGDLPDLLLPHCSLLQQQEFLQQMRSLTVTYGHAEAAAAAEGSGQHQQGGQHGCPSAAQRGSPARSFAAGLLKSQAPLLSFKLHPKDALYGAPFWLQPNQPVQGSIAGSNTASSSSSSSSRAKWHSPGPCTVMCPQRANLMGSAVLGRQWLPHLLQLRQLKHLTLPVVWVTGEKQQAQELAALRADLSAAAAAAVATAGDSGGQTSPLESLQLLLVPACLKGGLEVLQPPSSAGDSYCIRFRPELLQQLLQALLLELPQLQRLHLCVLGSVVDWASLDEVAVNVARQSNGLRSLTIAEVAGNEVSRRDLRKLQFSLVRMCAASLCFAHACLISCRCMHCRMHLRSHSIAATCVSLHLCSRLQVHVRLAIPA
jgi:hypothetical protein